jgi:tetratricopeptide (TPR) repeat protein
MNPHLLIVAIGIFFILIFGGMSFIRREGLSTQFALEVLGITALVEIIALLLNTTVDPIFFLIFIYLISMRGRLLVDIANMLSNRGRQRDAIKLLQIALRSLPDQSTRLVILVNMGIVQLRRKNPESAQSLLESVLDEGESAGLGIKYEAACRYNLGLALMQLGKEAEAIRQFNETMVVFPSSIYSRAAETKLEKARHAQHGKSDEGEADSDQLS